MMAHQPFHKMFRMKSSLFDVPRNNSQSYSLPSIRYSLPAPSRLLGHWLLLWAACGLSGWLLSTGRWLTPVGFAVSIPVVWLGFHCLCGLPIRFAAPRLRFRPWRKRLRRWAPAVFLFVALLVLMGGLLHPPNNMDALNYRMPRVMHWLMVGGWEWMPANLSSLNTRSCGFEWVTAPILGILRMDRLLFLINFVLFLFLPGLVFGVFRHLGISGRVAWTWMWLFPTGYCFALQAGSIGNDFPAAVFALAAFDFGLRWKQTKSWTAFGLSVVSAAIMTAVKPTTLPLLLPFAVLFVGMLRQFGAAPLRTTILALAAAAVSFLPTAALNHRHCGDWTGSEAERNALSASDPTVALTGNAINLAIQNLVPPVFPFAGRWNASVDRIVPPSLMKAMEANFEITGARFHMPDIQGEEWAGLGAGLSWLVLASVAWGIFKPPAIGTAGSRWFGLSLVGLFGFALVAYCAKAGMSTVGRHVSPYYIPLVGAFFLMVPQDQLVRLRLWNVAAFLAAVSAVALVILTPSRPLWPAAWFFNRLGDSPSPLVQRARTGYAVYADRADCLGPLRDALPSDALFIGFANYHSGPELPLWKPYMERRVRHLLPGDSISILHDQGMSHIILNTVNFAKTTGMTPDEWVARHQLRITAKKTIRLVAKDAPSEWWILEP